MSKPRILFISIIAAVICIIAGPMGYIVGRPLIDPEAAARTPDGYIKIDSEYFGHDRIQLNGKPLNTNPSVAVQERVMPPPWLRKTKSKDLNTLFGGAKRIDGPQITDYARLDAAHQHMPIEQRAILATTDQLARGGTVNVLPGRQYAPGVQHYDDFRTSVIDQSRDGFDDFSNPILYLERQGATVAAVLVTTSHVRFAQPYEFTRQWVSGAERYFETPRGVTLSTPAHGQFLTELDRYRAWNARRFDTVCDQNSVSSTCLYKLPQKEQRFQGFDQVIMVGRPNVLEYNTQDPTAGNRDIATCYTFSTNQSGQTEIANDGSQYIYPQTKLTIQKQLQIFHDDGGHVLSGADLATLPTFALSQPS